jgi:hypothetical protein
MLQDPKIGPKFFHNECMRILFKRKGVVVPIIEKMDVLSLIPNLHKTIGGRCSC